MALKLSTGLVNATMAEKSFKAALEGTGAAGFFIDIHSGARPASPNDAATGTKLARITAAAGARLHFAAAAVDGVIAKAAAETWQATGLANADTAITPSTRIAVVEEVSPASASVTTRK